MNESAFLNQNEQHLIDELDRFVDLVELNSGERPDCLHLSKKQVQVLKNVYKKVMKHPGMYTSFDLEKNTYRGILLVELNRRDPARRRRKDIMELEL